MKNPMVQPIIEQADWDFSACPQNELHHCLYYEYARTSAVIKDVIDKWRKDFPRIYASHPAHEGRKEKEIRDAFDLVCRALASVDSLYEFVRRHLETPDDKDLQLFCFFLFFRFDPICGGGPRYDPIFPQPLKHSPKSIVCLCPEFPEQPWLAIRPEERCARIGFLGDAGSWALPLNERMRICQEQVTFSDVPAHYLKEGELTRDFRLDWNHGLCHEYRVFRINWALDNESLKDQFVAWLTRVRKDRHPPVEDRGRPKDPRTLLKALSALRLRKLVFSWKKAYRLTNGLYPLREAKYPNGEDASQWRRAVRLAKRFLAEFEGGVANIEN